MSEVNHPDMLETLSTDEKYSEDAMLFLFKSNLLQCGLHIGLSTEILTQALHWVNQKLCMFKEHSTGLIHKTLANDLFYFIYD